MLGTCVNIIFMSCHKCFSFFLPKRCFHDMFSYLNLLDHVLTFICLFLVQEPALGKTKQNTGTVEGPQNSIAVRHTTWLPYKVMQTCCTGVVDSIKPTDMLCCWSQTNGYMVARFGGSSSDSQISRLCAPYRQFLHLNSPVSSPLKLLCCHYNNNHAAPLRLKAIACVVWWL